MEFDKYSLIGQKRKIILMTKELEYKKQIMHIVIAHWLVPSQSLSSMNNFSPVYIRSVMPYGIEYPFGQLGSPITAVSLLPSLLAVRQVRSWKVFDTE